MKLILHILLLGITAVVSATNYHVDTIPIRQIQDLVSNDWGRFETASPSSEIPQVELPSPTFNGTANMTIPIEVPEARKGHEPELTITYNNEGGKTWLGQGWDLSLPAITVETRWGVPRYTPSVESENYLLGGEQLGPLFHREEIYERKKERVFYFRQDLDHDKVIRHGDSPSNYWWEVKHKDGSIDFYGGDDRGGISTNHTIKTPSGDVSHWQLHSSRDVYGNVIRYDYQKVVSGNGQCIYPLSISYNGTKEAQGTYSVEFLLNDNHTRKDGSIDLRTGSAMALNDVLGKIVVKVLDEVVRSYEFDYEEGEFGATLLQSIRVKGSDGDEFYDYNLKYYNDIRDSDGLKVYGSPITWVLAKDRVDYTSLLSNIDLLNARPTILGGATTQSDGFGLAVTVGPPFNAVTKDFSAGPFRNDFNSSSEGVTALIDIDGDGLADKVWKESTGLYFRSNMLKKTGSYSFGPRLKINGISSFSKAATSGRTIGAELTAPPVFGAYFGEKTTSVTDTYLADFNGDELIDIASGGQVYFNHIESGIPTFTTNSGDTPSPIIKGEDVVNDAPTSSELAELARRHPLNDAVRSWRAQFSGRIRIEDGPQLLQSNDPNAESYADADGVIVSIQHGGIIRWIQRIEAGDFTKQPIGNIEFDVEQGDLIYFRVQSVDDGNYDEVEWTPTISYFNRNISEVDENKLLINQYNPRQDAIHSNKHSTYLSKSGVISVKGQLRSPPLSDSLHIIISGDVTASMIIPPWRSIDSFIGFDSIEVAEGASISLSLSSNSNVDWTNLNWSPQILYQSYSDGSTTVDAEGKPLETFCPDVHKAFYYPLKSSGGTIIPEDGYLTVNGDIIITWPYELTAICKVYGQRDTSFLFDIIENNIGNPSFEFDVEVYRGDTVFVSFLTQEHFSTIFQPSIILSAQLNGNRLLVDYAQGTLEKIYDGELGHEYRGWGQFGYNPTGDIFPWISLPNNSIDTTGLAGDTSIADPNSTNDDLEGSNVDLEDKFIVMYYNNKNRSYLGADTSLYVSESIISSTRYRLKNLSGSSLQGQGLSAPNLIVKTEGEGGYGGLGVGPAEGNLGYTGVTTYSEKDIGDFNGDRYPDIITPNYIQYTDVRGAMTNQKVPHGFGIHEAKSGAWVKGLGRTPATSSAKNAGGSTGKGSNKSTARTKSRNRSGATKSRSANKSARTSVGVSGSFSDDEDHATHTYLDINGDGLEDKLWKGGRVALGTGYGFLPASKWDFEEISYGVADDRGAGLGVNISNGSIQAGVSGSRTTNYAHIGFVDLNDDALLDYVESVEPLMVKINTGTQLLPAVEWGAQPFLDTGTGIGESANGAFTFCLEFLFFRVCFNPSTFKGQGSSGINSAFQDINGDGYVDYLQADVDDSNLRSQLSKVGRTNFLKSVEMPLGGTYTLDYTTMGNTYDMPFSKWVMKSLTVDDKVEVDGGSTFQHTFEYENGRYDRYERQFFGFDKVVEKHLNDQGIAERSIISEYHLDSYYTKGLLQRRTVISSNGQAVKEESYAYQYKNPITGEQLPTAILMDDNTTVFPALIEKTNTLFDERMDSYSWIDRYDYDRFGNVLTTISSDDSGNYSEHISEFVYDTLVNYFTTGINKKIVKDRSTVLEESSYILNQVGLPIKISRRIDDENIADTDVEYDAYFNEIGAEKPKNFNGDRLQLIYEYDDVFHQFIMREVDGYELSKRYNYDFLHQEISLFIDENDNKTIKSYDQFGRLKSVLYPTAQSHRLPISIAHEYNVNQHPAYAKSTYFSPQGELSIANYADGLQRSIQEQRQYIFDGVKGYIASSWIELDDLQRQVVIHHPQEVLNQEPGVNLFNTTPSLLPEVYEYDALDRVTSYVDNLDSRTTIRYQISEVRGRVCIEEISVNPAGNSSSAYRDSRGNLIASRVDGPNGDIWRHYKYDAVNQLIKAEDPLGNVSSYEHDMTGVRIGVETPEGGYTRLDYDAANNLLAKSTATIRATINEDDHVRYTYDKERLIGIDYPKNFQNNVRLHYGSAQDSFNRRGRVWLVEDATGGREFFFNTDGRVVKEIRTVMVNRSLTHTFVTEYEYDTWGRILKMVYPDGEIVHFNYGYGGELEEIWAKRDNHEYPIVKQAVYDQYQDLVKVTYGNEVNNTNSYDIKGRLVNVDIRRGTDMYTQKTIRYDVLDNIIDTEGDFLVSDQRTSFKSNNEYDQLNRVKSASGELDGNQLHTYTQKYDYNDVDQLFLKDQLVERNDAKDQKLSLLIDYNYDHPSLPNRPSEIAGKTIDYDPNGNVLLISSRAIFDYDQHIYDEENRLMGASNNGMKSRYTYDAFGQRVLKSSGSEQGLFVNGAPAGFVAHTDNFIGQVNPYFTIDDDGFYKHYFMKGKRIETRKGTGKFVTTLDDGPDITAGGINYKTRIASFEQEVLEYYASLGVAPGAPTLLAYMGQPEVNHLGLPNSSSGVEFNPPPNWPNLSPPDTTGPPGIPIFYKNAGLTNENVRPGFNHVDGSIAKELWANFYHYDENGNVSLITDNLGTTVSVQQYLSSGEIWFSDATDDVLFNYGYQGKLLDQETGYIDFGDAYYNPRSHLMLSSDPVFQVYGEKTIAKRVEGEFFYEYAEGMSTPGFDLEILNSEKPDPISSNSINVITLPGPEDNKVFRYSFKERTERKRAKKRALANAKKVQSELNQLINDFNHQDNNDPATFTYDDFGSFAKYQNEKKKYEKRQKRQKAKRKNKRRSKRKVRFK